MNTCDIVGKCDCSRSHGAPLTFLSLIRLVERPTEKSVEACSCDPENYLVILLAFHSTLVFEKIARKDIASALENLDICGEVVKQYPGVCRFTMW